MSRQVDIKAIISHIVCGDGINKCRICMGDTSEGQVYLGDTIMMDGDKQVTLGDVLETITGVQVAMSPELPSFICLQCSMNAVAAIPFIKTSLESAKKWENITDYFLQMSVTDRVRSLYVVIEGDTYKVYNDTVFSRTKTPSNSKETLAHLKKRQSLQRPTWKRRSLLGKFADNKASTTLRCLDCKKTFYTTRLLNIHLSDSDKRMCQFCKKLVNVDNMADHFRTHGYQAYSCKICQETYLSPAILMKHMKFHHKQGSHICGECNRSFKSAIRLAVHRVKHQKKICRGCNKIFTRPSCYRYHSKWCSGARKETLYICDYCSKEYKNKQSLKQHIEFIHLYSWIVQCEYCGKKFPNRSRLKEHENSHVRKEDRHICEICGAKYSTRRGYERHMKNHFNFDSSESPIALAKLVKIMSKLYPSLIYPCAVCDFILSDKYELISHLRENHTSVLK